MSATRLPRAIDLMSNLSSISLWTSCWSGLPKTAIFRVLVAILEHSSKAERSPLQRIAQSPVGLISMRRIWKTNASPSVEYQAGLRAAKPRALAVTQCLSIPRGICSQAWAIAPAKPACWLQASFHAPSRLGRRRRFAAFLHRRCQRRSPGQPAQLSGISSMIVRMSGRPPAPDSKSIST